MSDLEALCPSHTIDLRFNIQNLTKSNQKLLRSFLVFYYTSEVPDWISFLIEEELDSILSTERVESGGKIFKENLIIRQTFSLLGKELGTQILKSVYSERNLEIWYNTGKKLSSSFEVVRIPISNPKPVVRRRGHKGSSSNPRISKDQSKEVKMSRENQELEETKTRIKLKQAKLFEERLDRYLQLESREIPSSERKRIFQSLLEPEEDSTDTISPEEN